MNTFPSNPITPPAKVELVELLHVTDQSHWLTRTYLFADSVCGWLQHLAHRDINSFVITLARGCVFETDPTATDAYHASRTGDGVVRADGVLCVVLGNGIRWPAVR